MTLAIVAVAILLSAITYGVLERLGRRAWLPATFRAVAWTGLGLLVLNVGCPATQPVGRPLTLVDGSLSARADSATYHDALVTAREAGDVLFFGDERAGSVATPRGRSRLAVALQAALQSGRPVSVWTDGELEDGSELERAFLDEVDVTVVPRSSTALVAVTQARAPARVTAGDAITVTGELSVFEGWPGGPIGLDLVVDGRVLARDTLRPSSARTPFSLTGSTRGLPSGDHIMELRLAGEVLVDAAARRWLRLTVVPTPGVVVVAEPGDWDARFLYRALLDVADLPVRGYVTLAGDRWFAMGSLEPVDAADVRRAARGADLLVLKGRAAALGGATARSVIRWPGGEAVEPSLAGDWYLSAGAASPLAGALARVALDSFPPAIQITPIEVPADAWVGLEASLGRRGAPRPVVVGHSTGRRREIQVAADGLWRWAFQGGSSEQGYRAWVAGMTTWLLAGVDSAAGVARPVTPIVSNGRPVLFRWQAPEAPVATPMQLTGSDGVYQDTLSFDGSGTARVWLPVGSYRYAFPDGTGGLVGVEPYSEEWLPRPVTLQARRTSRVSRAGTSSAREILWLFGVVVVALTAEWLARRSLGLR